MNVTPALIQHDLDKETLDEIYELRLLRLGIAEKQLANIKETAKSIAKQDGFSNAGESDILMMKLRIELTKKIALLKDRLTQKDVLFPDEIAFYLDIAQKEISLSHSRHG